MLQLPKFLDDHYGLIVITSVLGLLTLWVVYETAYGEYCAATCQAKKAQELRDRQAEAADRTEKSEPKCYGIYCDRTEEKEEKGTQEIIERIHQKNFISIRLSNSCKLIDYCPTVKELADLYDNSNKFLSGDFYFDNETNKWKREKPRSFNIFEQYKFLNYPWVLWVEPDHYTWINSKQIEIYPQLPTYLDRSDIIEERTRIQYTGLHLEECATAKIGWKVNGQEILLDVLNHFYSNCKESVKFDPTVEIFLGSKIFEDCDRECFFLREQLKLELKAYYQTQKEFEDHYGDGTTTSEPKTCFGIYCDREDENVDYPEDRPQTVKEKYEERKLKEQRYQERLKELEDIQECEKYKRQDPNKRLASKVDCDDDSERNTYLKDKRKEFNVEKAENKTEPTKEVKCYGIHCPK